METTKDGRTWRIGTAAEVAWIANGTAAGPTIAAAIPAVFEAHATVHPLEDERIDVQECALVRHLADRSGDQPWWLGFLDPTGRGKARWTMRWKPALNAFAITFADRWPAAETY
ncbi:MAG TPA: hypothetical protein VIM10_19170 [Actinopolymorphaceae bacterium]|jgi:hypothetical protein